MKSKNLHIVLSIIFWSLISSGSIYSQEIGLINNETLSKYRADYLLHSNKFISQIANKKKLAAVIKSNDLIWISSDKNKVDITEELLNLLKSNENTLPKIEKNKFNDESMTAIKNVFKSLRKIKTATEVGINFSLYGEKVVETTGEVGEYMLNIPDSDLKNELQKSMDAYSDALSIWNDCFQYEYLFIIKDLPIIKKYNIELSKSSDYFQKIDDVDRSIILSTIWFSGQKNLETAEKIYSELK